MGDHRGNLPLGRLVRAGMLRRLMVLVLAMLALTACLSEESCGCSVPEQATPVVYLIEGDHLVPTEATVNSSGRPGFDAVKALLFQETHDGPLFNGWNVPPKGPAAPVRGVTHRRGVVTVDFEKSPWDPYPVFDPNFSVDGALVTQQLVRTVQKALGTRDPVLVTVRGKPARGVWLEPLDGPVGRR